jgi:hypothetical protein
MLSLGHRDNYSSETKRIPRTLHICTTRSSEHQGLLRRAFEQWFSSFLLLERNTIIKHILERYANCVACRSVAIRIFKDSSKRLAASLRSARQLDALVRYIARNARERTSSSIACDGPPRSRSSLVIHESCSCKRDASRRQTSELEELYLGCIKNQNTSLFECSTWSRPYRIHVLKRSRVPRFAPYYAQRRPFRGRK